MSQVHRVQWIRQFVLALLLFLVGSAIYWFEFRYSPQQEEKKEQAKKVWVVPPGEVQSLRLVNEQKTLAFQCTRPSSGENALGGARCDEWKMVEPLVSEADSGRVKEFLTALDGLKSTQVLDVKKDGLRLENYGLEESGRSRLAQVLLQTTQGRVILYLGSKHPLSPSWFVGLEQFPRTTLGENWSQLEVIPQGIEAHWTHEVAYWRNKIVFTGGVKSEQLVAVEVHQSAESGPWKIVRKDNHWSSVGAWSPALDDQAVDQWLRSLNGLTLEAFLSETPNPSLLKGANRFFSLSLIRPNGSDSSSQAAPVRLEVYRLSSKEKQPLWYATVSEREQVFRLADHLVSQINIKLESLRNKVLLKPDERFSVQTLKIQVSGQKDSLVLVQNQGIWKAEREGSISSQKVVQFLEDLSKSRVQEFISLPKGGLASNRNLMKVELQNASGGVVRAYEFWEKDGKMYGQDQQGVFSSGVRPEFFQLERMPKERFPWKDDFFADKPAVPSSTTVSHENS